ncbi:MFS transporter [Thermodesulfitimonas autotrophica]|uniref:MFS transporter n=1 Tax=Thermodesulfitimonas autotrophica TaxID=1894989 RepID=UPI002FDF2933
MKRKSRGIHYGWVILAMGMIAALGAHGFGRMAYTLILPAMKEGLALSYTQAGLLGTANFLGYLISAFCGGFLATRFNSRFVIGFSLLLMGCTMFLTGLAQSFSWAFAMRFLTGLGHGSAYVPSMALGSVWFAKRYRGFATGVVSSGTGIGIVLGALLVPRILAVVGPSGWRYAWFCLGAALATISFVCLTFLRPRPESLGLSPIGRDRTDDTEPRGTGDNPPDWRSVYRIRTIWHFGAVYFTFGLSYVIYLTFFAAYLRSEIGWSTAQASDLWGLVGMLTIFCGLIWGTLSDHVGRNRGLALAFFILTLSYLLFAFVKTAPALYLSAVLFGLTYAGIPTIMAAAAGDHLGRRLAPAGLGFLTLFFGIGQALGPAAGGYLAEICHTFTWSYTLAAAAAAIGMMGSLLLPSAATAGTEPLPLASRST